MWVVDLHIQSGINLTPLTAAYSLVTRTVFNVWKSYSGLEYYLCPALMELRGGCNEAERLYAADLLRYSTHTSNIHFNMCWVSVENI